MIDAVEFFLKSILSFVEIFFNVIPLNFISFYLGVLRDGNPIAGLYIF